MTRAVPVAEPAAKISREVLVGLFGPPQERTFAVCLWDGTIEEPPGDPRFTLVRRLAGERTYRTWRLYMSGSARAFATGRIGVVQALFSRTREDGLCELPLTRADLYQERRPTRPGGPR
jgi:hypothetical protein